MSLKIENNTQALAIQELRYSLVRRVPEMMRGFSITTNYGEIVIEPEFAEAFRNLAADTLQYQLNIMEQSNRS